MILRDRQSSYKTGDEPHIFLHSFSSNSKIRILILHHSLNNPSNMQVTFIIASFFAALVAAAPAAVDTRSVSAVEIEARQVCTTQPVFALFSR